MKTSYNTKRTVSVERAEGRGSSGAFEFGQPEGYGSVGMQDMAMKPASHSHTSTRIAPTIDGPNEFEGARGAARVWNKVRPKSRG